MMMARAKRIYILLVKVNKLFSFSSSRCFLKEIENMFFAFLSSYNSIRVSVELYSILEKAAETLAYRPVFPQHFSFSQTFTSVSTDTPKLSRVFLLILLGSNHLL